MSTWNYHLNIYCQVEVTIQVVVTRWWPFKLCVHHLVRKENIRKRNGAGMEEAMEEAMEEMEDGIILLIS